jgi:hypothetical protein
LDKARMTIYRMTSRSRGVNKNKIMDTKNLNIYIHEE